MFDPSIRNWSMGLNMPTQMSGIPRIEHKSDRKEIKDHGLV